VHNLTGLFALRNSTLLGFARYSSALRYTLLVTLLFSAALFISLRCSLRYITMLSFAVAVPSPALLSFTLPRRCLATLRYAAQHFAVTSLC